MDIKVFVSSLGAYNNGFLTGHWTKLPVKDVKRDIIDKVDGAIGDEFFITDFESPFPIDQYASLSALNEIASILEEEEINDLYSLYRYVIDNCTDVTNKLSCAVVESFDDDETFNQMLSGYTPIQVASALGDINFTDDYLYWDGNSKLCTMSESHLQEMIKKDADELIRLFAEDHNIEGIEYL